MARFDARLVSERIAKSPFRAGLRCINNKLIDASDDPDQDWVQQLNSQGGMGVTQCVGDHVGTARIATATCG
jgi:hypothetical protein